MKQIFKKKKRWRLESDLLLLYRGALSKCFALSGLLFAPCLPPSCPPNSGPDHCSGLDDSCHSIFPISALRGLKQRRSSFEPGDGVRSPLPLAPPLP